METKLSLCKSNKLTNHQPGINSMIQELAIKLNPGDKIESVACNKSTIFMATSDWVLCFNLNGQQIDKWEISGDCDISGICADDKYLYIIRNGGDYAYVQIWIHKCICNSSKNYKKTHTQECKFGKELCLWEEECGGYPSSICIDNTLNNIYATNDEYDSFTLLRIKSIGKSYGSTKSKPEFLIEPKYKHGAITVNNDVLYVVRNKTNEIYLYDVNPNNNKGKLLRRIQIPDAVLYKSKIVIFGNELYIACMNGQILAVNTDDKNGYQIRSLFKETYKEQTNIGMCVSDDRIFLLVSPYKKNEYTLQIWG